MNDTILIRAYRAEDLDVLIDLFARLFCRLPHDIAELVDVVGLADQREAVPLDLYVVGGGTALQLVEQPSHG